VAILQKVTHQCAQCGATIVAPEWSEYQSEHRVRHTRSCETCGYQFESTVYLPASEVAAAI
jgi:ribosomal protein L37AE/L43A